MQLKDTYEHVTGSNKVIHFAKPPLTFNTSMPAEIALSDTFFLHQQDLALLVTVRAFLPTPSLVTLLPPNRFRIQLLNFRPALFDDSPALLPHAGLT